MTIPKELCIKKLIEWIEGEKNRLRFPPIQRSVVWSNEQVIHYWDSLLRGYPAGLMMVCPVECERSLGRDADGKTHETTPGDFYLFDGQQRMAALLLALGRGPMKASRKLWVDLGSPSPNPSSGLKFQLRITSVGQPFGYKPDAPNQKIEIAKLREKWKEKREQGMTTPMEVFENVDGNDIIGAKCAVPFKEISELLLNKSFSETIKDLSSRPQADRQIVEYFIGALEKALNTPVPLQEIDPQIGSNPEECIRLYRRLGQGGTRLSDDELTYSIIKHHYPYIHDSMQAIKDDTGRLAGEVDLVLAALRVAKATAEWPEVNESERISRPTPAFVSQLKDKEPVREQFNSLIPLGPPNAEQAFRLQEVLRRVRKALSYDPENNPNGFPSILLARLPSELIDVLILFACKRNAEFAREESATLCAFALYWLLFVDNNSKAAWLAFSAWLKDSAFTQEFFRELIKTYEDIGVARPLPRQPEVFKKLRQEVQGGDHVIRQRDERFKAADSDSPKSSDTLRILSTNIELIKRALLWCQRADIVKEFPTFDPTSERDEDLPIDLDHIIPRAHFLFDWREREQRLEHDAVSEEFRSRRHIVGNSLGNYCWQALQQNRQRQDGPLTKQVFGIEDIEIWNRIISIQDQNKKWSKDDIATFQRLIDLRTLDLYERLLTKSGIIEILPQ